MFKGRMIFITGLLCALIVGCDRPASLPNPSPPSTADSDITQGDFVMTWLVEGSALTIQSGEGVFDYQVDWDNDGTFEEARFSGPAKHIYAAPGTYTVRLKGRFPHARLCDPDLNQQAKLLSVDQWGDQRWGSMREMFYGCERFKLRAADKPDLRDVTDMRAMFKEAKAFNQPIGSWDVSHVTDMSQMFREAKSFNQPLSSWNTSNVTNMHSMFKEAKAFNQPIGSWDVSHVTSMSSTFHAAKSFNQPLVAWSTSKVTDMSWMFKEAKAFNQPVDAWDTSNVTSTNSMFHYANVFNQPIESWDVSQVIDMSWMFREAKAFNQSLAKWKVGAGVNVEMMFEGADAFNQDLSTWQAKP